jgi:antitoxin component YwqK of YwqJK toxin-antitoxin module
MSEEEKAFSVTHFWKDEEYTYYEGKRFTGVCVDYYSNVQKKYEKRFIDGKESSLWTNWREDGFKKDETDYVYGKKHGNYVSFHPADGEVWLREVYKYGLCLRHCDRFFKNGQPMEETIYRGEDGWAVFDAEILLYENGGLKREINYLENNHENNDERHTWWYENVQKESEEYRKDNITNGLQIMWEKMAQRNLKGVLDTESN